MTDFFAKRWIPKSLLLLALPILSLAASNDSLLWGPYRPNLYFGVRPRIPKSLMTSLMWARAEDYKTVQRQFRYTCEQSDNMAGYGWEEYDVRTGGTQTMYDVDNNIDITTEFAKVPGGSNGGNWGVRIKGRPREGALPDLRTSVVFSANLDGLGSMHLKNDFNMLGYEGDVSFEGQTPDLGDFTLKVTKGPESNKHPGLEHHSAQTKPLDRTHVGSIAVPPEHIWQTKPLLFQTIKEYVDKSIKDYGQEDLPPASQLFTISDFVAPNANMHLIQKVFTGPFEFDVLYSSASAGPMTSEDLTRAIQSSKSTFDDRYKDIFKAGKPFDDPEYEPFGKALFSNLLGGIGYFYGDSVVDLSNAPEYEEDEEGFWTAAQEAQQKAKTAFTAPYELFTSVPSRPFFPRGFLWDEGFHLLPILDWDIELSLEIVQSWMKTMNEDGWIAREQILGDEARSKVPPEFTVQRPHIANPPTLMLVFEGLLSRLEEASATSAIPRQQREEYKKTLKAIYPLLVRHYDWYRKTQKGDLKSYDREASSQKEAYRWRARTPTHVLASGLDDYPRSQPPHPGELHLDLMSWMGMMSRSMARVANFLGENADSQRYQANEKAIVRNLDDLHWSEKEKAYCDATIDEFEDHALVCHKGYISLFPFMTGLVAPESPKLGAILDLIGNEDELWSPYGIRSLSKQDPLAGSGENYWRSPVWMNMNYLILMNLHRIATHTGPQQKRAADLYVKLRKNLVDTVYESWKETGFAWEQYNPDTGKGQRTAHFTGWTSLVVKMMCMPEVASAGGIEHEEL